MYEQKFFNKFIQSYTTIIWDVHFLVKFVLKFVKALDQNTKTKNALA